MKSKAKAATVAEKARMARLKEIGCVACIQRLQGLMAVCGFEVHHLLSGNKRRGHAFTIPLCSWHHRGQCGHLWTTKQAEALLGPSLALRSKKFHETYGSDNELLALTNELLEKHDVAA